MHLPTHAITHAHTICCLSQRALYNRAGFAHPLQALGTAPDWPVLQLLELIDRDNCNHHYPTHHTYNNYYCNHHYPAHPTYTHSPRPTAPSCAVAPLSTHVPSCTCDA